MAPGDGGASAAALVLALAREERELIDDGRADELEALHERRTAAMSQLPADLSLQARAHLLEALGLQQAISASLATAVAIAGEELGRVGHGRTAMRGYTPAGMDARRVLDQTA